MKKRIGNDITFTWHIYRKDGDTQVPESFTGKEVEVKLISPLQRPVTIEDVSIATGVVTFSFKGKHQVTLGNYVAVLQENRGEDGMVTLDVVNAVTLVPHSYMEEDGDEGDVIEAEAVELTSTISAGGGGGIEQQQADWAQTDDTAVDYIKNKPNLNEYVPKMDDDGHGNMSIYSPGNIVLTLANEQGFVNQTGSFWAGGWSVSSPNGKFQTFGNSIYRGTMGIDHDSVVWEKTAIQQIPAATTSVPGLMSAEDKGKLNDLPTATELAQELGGKANSADLATVATSGSYNDLSDKPDLSAFITNSVDDLVNYYLKSETYTKIEVQQLIGAIQQFHYEVYPTLPQTGASNVLYLIGPTGTGTDKYEEYVYANNDWTKIGDSSIDLSGYVTTEALTTALAGYVTSSALSTALANYYNKTEVDGLLASKADKNEMSVVQGTGTDADKTTITLKQGTSATVLTTHQDITGKEDITPIEAVASGTTAINAAVNTYYEVAGEVGALAITLPTPTDLTKVSMVVIHLTAGTNPNVVIGSEATIDYSAAYDISASKEYEINCLYNSDKWVVADMEVV